MSRSALLGGDCGLNHRLAAAAIGWFKNGLGRGFADRESPRCAARATVDGRIRKGGAALGGPTRITVPEAHAELRECRVLNLGDAALVDTEFRCNVTVLPVQVKQERDDSVLPLREALPGAAQVHSIRETS